MLHTDLQSQKKRVVGDLKFQGIIRSKEVERAILTVPREEFLPPDVKVHAYVDSPLPIGHGQTTSAIHMTAMFCEHGELMVGKKVLEVGGGCGYMSCVYAELVAPLSEPEEKRGHVWTVEIVRALAYFSIENVKRTGYSDRVTVIHGDGSLGLPEHQPFDTIIVTSAAPDVPQPLIDQLGVNGMLLIPVGMPYSFQELKRIRKYENGRTRDENLGGVAFVPMRGQAGWKR